MGSPPQGYIANALAVGGNQIKNDSSGRLSINVTNGKAMYWESDGTMHLGNIGQATQLIKFDGTAINVFGTSNSLIWGTTAGGGFVINNELDSYAGVTPGAGDGIPYIYALDKRSGLTSADGSPITLVTATAGTPLYRITMDIFATAVSAGTANYTITWTENAQSKTLVVSASVVNTLATATDLINPDAGTVITVQLTFAAFTGTVKVAATVERLSP